MENERVREEIADYLAKWFCKGRDFGSKNMDKNTLNDLENDADQILSIDGIRVEAKDQSLPDNLHWHKDELEFEAYCAGHNDLIGAGFVKVEPKEGKE